MSKSIVRPLVLVVLSVFTVSAAARAQSAQALIRETAKTMGGIAALRSSARQARAGAPRHAPGDPRTDGTDT